MNKIKTKKLLVSALLRAELVASYFDPELELNLRRHEPTSKLNQQLEENTEGGNS